MPHIGTTSESERYSMSCTGNVAAIGYYSQRMCGQCLCGWFCLLTFRYNFESWVNLTPMNQVHGLHLLGPCTKDMHSLWQQRLYSVLHYFLLLGMWSSDQTALRWLTSNRSGAGIWSVGTDVSESSPLLPDIKSAFSLQHVFIYFNFPKILTSHFCLFLC
jgi:hypothetical protein